MSHGHLQLVVRHLRRLAGQDGAEPTDRQLLERFAAGRDEDAFAALVERHGALVWGVCRRALRHTQDAEDAFQATFLVLARKAAVVRWRDSVHNWLYEVASRVSAEARSKAARRRRHEAQAAGRAPTEARPDDAGRELAAVLDEELHRLPARYRAALLLCYLEGKTSDQAARHLGWSLRTLQRRLAQGRELLRHRLTRRGITLSAALLVPALAEGAGVPPALTNTTIKAGLAFTAGGAGGNGAVLAEGVLRGMLMSRLRIVLGVLLLLGTITGAGVLTERGLAARPAPATEPPTKEAPAAGKEGDRAGEVAVEEASFAGRLWEITELVQAKHPEPPARQEMILAATKALLKAAGATPPDDLERRVARLKTREQLTTFLKDVWPRGGAVPPAEKLQATLLEGLFAVIPGEGAFYHPQEQQISEQISGNRYIGIGIQIAMHQDEKFPQIVIPFKGGPAARAGALPNDLIVEVNGKSTQDVGISKAVEMLRGAEGTTLTVALRAPGAKEARTVKMTRTVVPFETVHGYRRAPEDAWDYRIDPKGVIGYVRLDGLRASAAHELRQVERQLRSQGARALVIDLRSNAGASELHNGTLVADALLDGGLMWRLREADNKVKEFRADRECYFRGWPMVVLVNDGLDTTGAAVAAALQDNGRAPLVGEPTLSGGFVVSLLPLPDGHGAIALRTGRLERVAKDRAWPVEPDHAVPLTKEQRAEVDKWLQAKMGPGKPDSPADKPPPDPQLDKAVELLQAALKK